MSDLNPARLIGDAITAPIRVASIMRKDIGAINRVAADTIRDNAALAVAATQRTAEVIHGENDTADTDLTTGQHVTIELPELEGSSEVDISDRAHVHVHRDGETVTYAVDGAIDIEHHKVHYDFFSGIAPEIRHPGGSLPGANRWDAPVSLEHPNPVVLVHGTAGGGQTNWGTYVPLLANHGFSVFSLTYGAIPGSKWPLSAAGGMRHIEDSAAEVGEFIDKVLDATGADKVDVIGHSQGTIVPNYWAKFLGGADKIRRYVSLAPLWHGTTAFGALKGRSAFQSLGIVRNSAAGGFVLTSLSFPQMIADSKFIKKLNEGGTPYVKGIEYFNISTEHDEFVVPYTNGQVEGPEGYDVTNIIVQEYGDGCADDHSDHLAICGSRRAATIALNCLDDVKQHEVPCEVVPPFFG